MAKNIIQKQTATTDISAAPEKQSVNQIMNSLLDGEKLRGRFDELKLIPEPLNGRTGHKNGAFQRVVHLTIQAPANGGHQTILGENRLLTGVHQQECAGTVCTFGITGSEAGLTEQGRLLVTGCTGNRNGRSKEMGRSLTIDAAAFLGCRQHGRRNSQSAENFFIPL